MILCPPVVSNFVGAGKGKGAKNSQAARPAFCASVLGLSSSNPKTFGS
jgi:hypothetical protein